MNPLTRMLASASLALLVGIGVGWSIKGWKVGSDLSKALEAQQKKFNADLEVKNANLEVVANAYADLSGVRVQLHSCKANLNTSAQEAARTRLFYEERQRELDAFTERYKSDALECDLFVEDLRSK